MDELDKFAEPWRRWERIKLFYLGIAIGFVVGSIVAELFW